MNNYTDNDLKLLREKYPNNLDEVINKINNNYPVQYLIGNVDFYNINLNVDERALIPRFETEYLVEKLIKRLKKIKVKLNIIDLGTGSGAIAISLKKNLDCNMTALDINSETLNLTKENIEKNNVEITLINNDMLDENLEGYNIIVSNPPYVSENDEVSLNTKYEPQIALYAKEDGFYLYNELIKKISKLRKKPLLIAFEINERHRQLFINIHKEYLKDYKLEIEQDLCGKDRFVFFTKNE